MESSQTSPYVPPAHSHTVATPTPRPFTIAIVGGGIGGLALAIGLSSHNVPVHIYEAAPGFAEIGAGITIGPNMQRAISLLSPALGAATEKISTPMGWETKWKNNMTLRLGMDLKHATENGSVDSTTPRKAGDLVVHWETTREVGWGKSRSTVHRAKLLDEMVKLLPEGIATFNKAILNIRDEPDGKGVILQFADGTTATASAVIGCDGIRSCVRQAVLGEQNPSAKPQFTGVYCYRVLVPMEKAINAMGVEMARNTVMNMGYGGWVFSYPIDNFSTVNLAAGRFKDEKWDHEKWIRPATRATMFSDFEGWGDDVIKLLECIHTPEQWAVYDSPDAETFYRGNVCLLGDSAHASTPYGGTGASMALEDAFILSNLIGTVERAKDLEKVFEVYDEVRRPRGLRNVVDSRDLGNIWMLRGVGIGDDLRKLTETLLGGIHDWIWYIDLESELKLAKEMLDSKIKKTSSLGHPPPTCGRKRKRKRRV